MFGRGERREGLCWEECIDWTDERGLDEQMMRAHRTGWKGRGRAESGSRRLSTGWGKVKLVGPVPRKPKAPTSAELASRPKALAFAKARLEWEKKYGSGTEASKGPVRREELSAEDLTPDTNRELFWAEQVATYTDWSDEEVKEGEGERNVHQLLRPSESKWYLASRRNRYWDRDPQFWHDQQRKKVERVRKAQLERWKAREATVATASSVEAAVRKERETKVKVRLARAKGKLPLEPLGDYPTLEDWSLEAHHKVGTERELLVQE